MGTAIVVTSGKGGVGKTTTTANVGSALAKAGQSVALVDADIGLRNLDLVLGLENRIVYDVVDVVEGYAKLRQALIRDKRFDNLYLLPAAQTKDKTAVSPEQMRQVVHDLKEDFDFVVVDCPAGIEQGFRNAVSGADAAVIVTTPEVAAVRDADRIIGLLEAEGIREPRLVLNRLRPQMVKRGDMMEIDDILDILAVSLLGVVPEDEYIVVSTNRGEPASLSADSKAGSAYRDIAQRLMGAEVPFASFEDQSGFFGRLRRLWGGA